jgi:hypothetical protein
MAAQPITVRSGAPAPETDFYTFRSYADGTTHPQPDSKVRTGKFNKGDRTPQINGRDVIWELKS